MIRLTGNGVRAFGLSMALLGGVGAATFGGAASAYAQSPAQNVVANAMVRFEAAITWASVSPTWRARRQSWVAGVLDSRTPSTLAMQLAVLEGAMGWSSVQPSWRRQRPSWLARLRRVSRSDQLAPLLLELETATRWEAVTPAWRGARGPWVAQVSSVRGY
ncbi:MAG: hypothetical protein JNK72_14095 [Myxococcales bacterium]|nr:hypothetical protein [Myxococcales bacterium]